MQNGRGCVGGWVVAQNTVCDDGSETRGVTS